MEAELIVPGGAEQFATDTALAAVLAEQGAGKGVIAPGEAWGRGMRCNGCNSETFRRNPAGPNPAR